MARVPPTLLLLLLYCLWSVSLVNSECFTVVSKLAIPRMRRSSNRRLCSSTSLGIACAADAGERTGKSTEAARTSQFWLIFIVFAVGGLCLPPDLKYATICYRSKEYTRTYWDNPLNVAYREKLGLTRAEFEAKNFDDPMCEELGSLVNRFGLFFAGKDHQRYDIPPEKQITKNTEFKFYWQRGQDSSAS
eukprot:TRINITY_DN61864_c0_g1_i1.p1 TRINITY_DN61864_c0_g1~~TRINITY_DN61864_c0_g1_i1.p1  ORF type:complete len:190 (-),score=16.70 TRINITY_DN61864_c0_g1_i1:58-627(-)